MKKIGIMLLLGIFSTMFFWGTASAGPSVDQQYTGGGASLAISSKQRMAQRFLPSMTGLSKVEIQLANVGSNQKVTVTIRHKTGLNWDETDVAKVSNQVAVNGWNTYDFDDVTVTKDGWYGIFVNADAGPQWKYNNGPSTYDRGYAIFDSDDYVDADFNFKTWGTDPVEIVEEQTNPGSDKTDDETGTLTTAGTTSGDVPAATVSSSIEKPTELVAAYADSMKLSWKASKTTAIDGYLIFRSETKGKNYTKIGAVNKSTLEYTDATAQALKTYYYVARAYEGLSQSASSNEASVTVPEGATPIAPQNLKAGPVSDKIINVVWDKNPETNISGYTATIYLADKEVEVKNIAPDKNNCLFSNLIADAEYTIKVVANNSLGKSSTPSEISQKTEAAAAPVEKEPIMSLTLWVLVGATAVLTAFLIIIIWRRHKKTKSQL